MDFPAKNLTGAFNACDPVLPLPADDERYLPETEDFARLRRLSSRARGFAAQIRGILESHDLACDGAESIDADAE